MKATEIDLDNLTFSFTETRSMYVAKCKLNCEWETGKIVPFGNLSLSPAATVLNYGQGLFEGMKAYRWEDGRVTMFRPERNAKRAAKSCKRLSMPEIPEALFLEAVIKKELSA